MNMQRQTTQDFAFLKIPTGEIACGVGNFVGSASPPASGNAFYINDFELSDPLPWKIPASFSLETEALEPLHLDDREPEIVWEDPQGETFWHVFEELGNAFWGGNLQKSVPVLTERGRFIKGKPETLIRRFSSLPSPYWPYGFRFGNAGMVGATPERFFTLAGTLLQTMALAGTARPENEGQFLRDTKEIEEHELVAEFLQKLLSDLGDVHRDPRDILRLGALIHFRSLISVDLMKSIGLNELIRTIHPTPAVGVLPRDSSNRRMLQLHRRATQTPANFGAPFGVLCNGTFHSVVSIRNLCWSGDEARLPSGCGVLAQSAFENEWLELGLKRSSVKELLGV